MERYLEKFEINPKESKSYKNSRMLICAKSTQDQIPQAIELVDHPFYIGVVYQPEFLSRPDNPHPLFTSFIEASLLNKESASFK